MENYGEIAWVEDNSIGWETGIQPGDVLISINGKAIEDIIDYKYLISDEYLLLEIQKPNGDIWEIDIEKEAAEDLGLRFKNHLLDRERSCANNCIFCFIDQLAPSMRDTLYYKDDDWRLSFLLGNYITLTNLSDRDINRIIRQRISPLYISVHTIDAELRAAMLNNKQAVRIKDQLETLKDGNISFHCQIVLCPGINDGPKLDETVEYLIGLYPSLLSIAVVPVGLTKYRRGLPTLKPFDEQSSKDVITQVGKWQSMMLQKTGSRLVYAADEFFITAGVPLPRFHEYEDFPQLENGVGLMSKFEKEFHHGLKHLKSIRYNKNKQVSIATGKSATQFLEGLIDGFNDRTGMKVCIHGIENRFFGPRVTVAGLVTGRDLLGQLSGKPLGQVLLIPDTMLRAGEKVFLDDMTVAQLSSALNTKVVPVTVDGNQLINTLVDFGRD